MGSFYGHQIHFNLTHSSSKVLVVQIDTAVIGVHNKKVGLYAFEIKLKNCKLGWIFIAVRDAINSRDNTRVTRAPSNYETISKRFNNYSPNCTAFDRKHFTYDMVPESFINH